MTRASSCWRFLVVAAAAAAAITTVPAAGVIVIDEDFESGVIDGNLIGTAVLQFAGDVRSTTLLSLTQGVNEQAGFAWFNTPFNLRDNKVTIEFDAWIRTGTSTPPADGMSVIFQFGSNTLATGAAGGGLGTGNFPTEYVSVAFDIWDNGDTDPETHCDNPFNSKTCHVEVNQNSFPGLQPSLQTNVGFGVDAPDFTTVGDTLLPLRTRIVFDSGVIEVFLQTDADPVFTSETLVLRTALKDFPDNADALIGFAASTGGANAHHEVDHLRVTIDDPTPQVSVDVRLGNGARGAINCGGADEVAGSVNGETYTFVPDVAFNGFLGTNTGVIPNENLFAAYGFIAGDNAGGPVVGAIQNAGDPSIESMYRTERWMNGPVAYRFAVDNGRYEVNLHFAEICPACGVSATGEATRRIHALLEDERALTHWSSALAAGNDLGTGPAALTAVVRTFQVDVAEGFLDVVISDVGQMGTPPENAQVNGISYRRIGNATGAALSGDVEDFGPIVLPDLAEELLVDDDFDAATVGLCPDGLWTCGSNGVHPPRIIDISGVHGLTVNPRLRLTDEAGSAASTIMLNTPVILGARGFKAEFTVFLTKTPSATAADGMTFFFVPADTVMPGAVGAGGGGLGYAAIAAAGFAVEIDTYRSDFDPNGIPQTGYGHVGLVVNGSVDTHVQTSAGMHPAFAAPGWPIALDTAGQYVTGTFDLENAAAAGMRVEVSLNNGRFEVYLASVNQDPGQGVVFTRTKVIDTLTDYGVTGLDREGYFGFSAATGGAVSYHEIDDVKIALILNRDVTVTRRPLPRGTVYNGAVSRIPMALDLTVEPDTGAHQVTVTERLPAGWSAADIVPASGTVAGGALTWNLSGVDTFLTLSYTLVPSDHTAADVVITGGYAVDDRPELPIEPQPLAYTPPPFPRGMPMVLFEEDFDDAPSGCPEGWTCNTNGGITLLYQPGVIQDGSERSGRLQLCADGVGNIASAVIWNTPIDLSAGSLVVEFDAYFSCLAGATPADGLTLMFLDAAAVIAGDLTPFLGAPGGALAYGGATPPLPGFAIEVDLWQGGTDPSGYNTTGYGHVAVVRDGNVDNHVQTHIDVDPNRIPVAAGGTGWPDLVDRFGSGFPLRFVVDYNHGNVKVALEAPDTGDGPFDEEILNTGVTFPGAGGGGAPGVLQQVYIGFTGATGGAFAYHEIDDLRVTYYSQDATGPFFRRGDANDDGLLNIADAITTLSYLFAGAAPPPCPDAADTNDDGVLNIADAITTLSHLFAGSGPLPPPFPDCGPDPTDDMLPPCHTTQCK